MQIGDGTPKLFNQGNTKLLACSLSSHQFSCQFFMLLETVSSLSLIIILFVRKEHFLSGKSQPYG
jgi:hypothetical protein